MIVCSSGKEATTHYKCLASKNNLSVVECKLESGRKHQIRVHMSYINHPCVGDFPWHFGHPEAQGAVPDRLLPALCDQYTGGWSGVHVPL